MKEKKKFIKKIRRMTDNMEYTLSGFIFIGLFVGLYAFPVGIWAANNDKFFFELLRNGLIFWSAIAILLYIICYNIKEEWYEEKE